MSAGQRAWLIAYDVADPRRLTRTHHFLKNAAVAVQYSVFVGVLTPQELGRLITGLRERIHPDEDDVRLYPVPSPCDVMLVGGSWPAQAFTLADRRLAPFLREQLGHHAGQPHRDQEELTKLPGEKTLDDSDL